MTRAGAASLLVAGFLGAGLFAAGTAFAASAIDGFDFTAEEAARYQRLIGTFRCPKCLNESLASSGAPIAVDLRRTVRRLIADGASDAAIRRHLQARYGDFVLYDPPLGVRTLLLWLLPAALGGAAIGVLVRMARRRPAAQPTAAERAEAQRLAAR